MYASAGKSSPRSMGRGRVRQEVYVYTEGRIALPSYTSAPMGCENASPDVRVSVLVGLYIRQTRPVKHDHRQTTVTVG